MWLGSALSATDSAPHVYARTEERAQAPARTADARVCQDTREVCARPTSTNALRVRVRTAELATTVLGLFLAPAQWVGLEQLVRHSMNVHRHHA
jgi:hypothetical protein